MYPAFLRDFSSAYHNVPLGTPCNRKCAGCRPCRGAMEPRAGFPSPSTTAKSRLLQKELLQAPAPPGCLWEQTGLQQVLGDLPTDYELTASLPTSWRQARFVGCRPGRNCNPNTCQKQLFGLELDGQYFRFAVAHFGIKPSGNAFHALLSPLIRHWQINYDVRIILWVDDICVIVPNMCTEQDTCGGADKCPECSRYKHRAWKLDAQFTKDIKALEFETNRKDVAPTTLAFFLGLGFDSDDGVLGSSRQSTNLWYLVQRVAHTR